jgi:glycosyltransferase involved in cell wall biosynthesis
MLPLSIVIVCKNEAGIIASTLESLQGITDDIIVYDNGSTDDTIEIVKSFQVHLYQGKWEGFGKTKNKANAHAKYDWILSLDADEAVDDELKSSLQDFDRTDDKLIYKIRFRNFLGTKPIRYGEWGRDWHTRLFNRNTVRWDEEPVHEKLILPPDFVIRKLKGFLLHRTAENISDYATKTVRYAMLNAEKYHNQGMKANWFKLRISPAYNFFYYFILKGGFLDGHAGYVCARMTAHYTFLKYARLKELNKQAGAKAKED